MFNRLIHSPGWWYFWFGWNVINVAQDTYERSYGFGTWLDILATVVCIVMVGYTTRLRSPLQ